MKDNRSFFEKLTGSMRMDDVPETEWEILLTTGGIVSGAGPPALYSNAPISCAIPEDTRGVSGDTASIHHSEIATVSVHSSEG